MANLPKSWIVDYSSTSTSSCKACKKTINQDVLRIGRRFASPYNDGPTTKWNHATCFPKFRPPFQAALHEVEGVDGLRWKDQERIIKYIGGAGQGSGGSTPDRSSNEFAIENASSHATCKSCNEKIVKGKVRISSIPIANQSQKRGEAPAWHHAKCFVGRGLWTSSMEKMPGWDNLTDEDKESVESIAKPYNLTDEDKESVQSIAKPYIQNSNEEKHGRKRDSKKRKVDECETLSAKKPNTRSENLDINLREGSSAEDGELELKLKKQADALWTIIDDLEKRVTKAELCEMLEANDQKGKGSAPVLRARCADGMHFGALGKCPICEGRLEYFDAQYVCPGNISAWSKCTFSTTNPERLKGKWNIPENINNEYLSKWFASQKEKELSRIFRPNSSKQPSQRSETAFFKDIAVAIAGNLKESRGDWNRKLQEAGGRVMRTLKQDAYCLVINESEESEDETYKTQIENATRMEVPVVGESFLVDCFKKKELLKVDDYRIKKIEDEALNKVKSRVRDSVHVSSGLQKTGHIFKEGESFYTITLNMCDLSSNINSYYILQIIEDDCKPVYHVFRKWDRVGNDRAFWQKLEKMPKPAAITLFKKLFLKYTGNEWEDWVNKGTFEKKADKYFLLDLDYRVEEPEEATISQWTARSKLDDRVLDLMKMLFDPKIYSDALEYFDIKMPVMPLGKLKESHILKGFEALKQVEDMIKLNEPDVRLFDASSHFFTLIPTVHPRVIGNLVDLREKNRMLEDLLEMAKAAKLMRFEIKDDDPFYANYKKLNCGISSLPRDSSDYKLIERYLKKTHAPTHDWELELEDAFRIDREGERDAYMPRKSNLKNCMLLWHGSRVSNFLGILSTGLRIAPPEAPSTGYMFGKGIYLADLGSKGSKYCNASNEYAMGLMLLSEVALGEVYETEKAEENAPKGKDSTKGVGMYKYSTEYEQWGDGVIVPCGGLDLESGIPSKIEKDYLKYNEYIVYKTNQVKLQFLVKVRFHYKKTSKAAGISDVKSS